MKIALLGYGKMGKEIEEIAISRNHKILIKSTGKETYDINECDIAIDFSVPSSAYENISHCLNNDIPVISGTTGWLDKYDDIKELCNKKNGSFIYSSNFSIGVNIFFELNKRLAMMMDKLSDYNVSIEEIHHIHKLDAPSGTAITLAEDIITNSSKKESWELTNNTTSLEKIGINSIRKDEIPGTHIIKHFSPIDSLTIKHEANNRKGFALGAVIAAEWLIDKKGVYTMKDVLNII